VCGRRVGARSGRPGRSGPSWRAGAAARPGRGDGAGSRRWRRALRAVAARAPGDGAAAARPGDGLLVREQCMWARGRRQGERERRARVGLVDLGFHD
jgi:hypothetical protein